MRETACPRRGLGIERSSPAEHNRTEKQPGRSTPTLLLPEVLPRMEVVAVIERPIQETGWAFVGTLARVQSLHELHKLIFRVIHHLSRNGRHPALLRHPLNLFAGHGTDEVGNILKPLLSLRRPGHPVARFALGIVHHLQRDRLISLFASKGLHTALHHWLHK